MTDSNDPVRAAATDSFVQRGADRKHLDLLTPEQFRQFTEMVVEMDANGVPVTWSGGLDK